MTVSQPRNYWPNSVISQNYLPNDRVSHPRNYWPNNTVSQPRNYWPNTMSYPTSTCLKTQGHIPGTTGPTTVSYPTTTCLTTQCHIPGTTYPTTSQNYLPNDTVSHRRNYWPKNRVISQNYLHNNTMSHTRNYLLNRTTCLTTQCYIPVPTRPTTVSHP